MILRLELLRTWRSYRPALAMASIFFFLLLMLAGFYTYANNETGGEAEFRYTFENRSYFNGLTFALHAFYFGLLLVLPIFAATEGGTHIAGETAAGTLFLLLTRPLSRTRLFLNKLAVATSVSVGLVGVLLSSSLLVGLLFVGWGDLDLYPGVLQMTDRHQHLSQSTALVRLLLVWPAASVALLAPLSLSFLVSAWSRSPVNAVGTSIALYLVMYVIVEIHFFRDLRPWLFTSYIAYWRELFQENVVWSDLFRDGAKLLGFSFLFLGLTLHRFRQREER
jgi:ABC-2 type transport system permease protein